jgi:osmotically-inducible protein OsmY
MPLLLGACGKRVNAAPADDATITARVRTALLNDPEVSALQVGVDTNAKVVTLTGTVRTAAERERAIAIAREVGGGASVRSELRVEP